MNATQSLGLINALRRPRHTRFHLKAVSVLFNCTSSFTNCYRGFTADMFNLAPSPESCQTSCGERIQDVLHISFPEGRRPDVDVCRCCGVCYDRHHWWVVQEGQNLNQKMAAACELFTFFNNPIGLTRVFFSCGL